MSGFNTAPLKAKFAKARSTMSRRLADDSIARASGNGASTLIITMSISKDVGQHRRLGFGSTLPSDLGERWAAIIAGAVPPDDEDAPPRPWTADELDELESEAMAEIDVPAKQRSDAVREHANDLMEEAKEEAHQAQRDMVLNPKDALRYMEIIEEAKARATQVRSQANDKLEEIAEEVREARAKTRASIAHQQEQRIEDRDNYVASLRSGLDGEITEAVERHYLGQSDVTIDEWELV